MFCLLAHQTDKETLNPLNLSQWEFYVVRTPDIDIQFGDRQSVTLREVRVLSRPYSVAELSNALKSAMVAPSSLGAD